MTINEPTDFSRAAPSATEPLLEYGPPGAERFARMQAMQQQAADCLRRLAARTPYPVINRGLVAANVVVFVGMVVSGVSASSPSVQDLRSWGALNPIDVFEGQWWRMFTAMFLHIGFVHLLLNMWALWNLGPFVERLLGNVGFTLTYLISGLLGSLASLYWNVDGISAGASGAIFGIVGGLLGFCLKQRSVLPPPLLSPLRNAGLTFVLINVALGFSIPGIDMAAHLGGLVGGVLCGFALSQPLGARAKPVSLRGLLVAAAAAATLLGGVVAVEYAHRNARNRLAAVSFMELAAARLEQSVTAYQAGELSAPEFASVLDREILPASRKAIRSLPDPAAVEPGERKDLQKVKQLLTDLNAELVMLNEALHSRDRQRIEQALDRLMGGADDQSP